jgi:hypothetical protein
MWIAGGTHLLVLQYTARLEFEFGLGLAPADKEKNVRAHTLIGEAVVRHAHGGGRAAPRVSRLTWRRWGWILDRKGVEEIWGVDNDPPLLIYIK